MRHKTLAISLTLACCLALALAASTPPGDEGKEVSLTGCLQAGSEPNSFVLKNIGTQAAAATEERPAEQARADTEYKLTAEGDVKLNDHVGQKVEVTGMIAEESGAATVKVKRIKQIAQACE